MADETTVIHNRIPKKLDDFIERMAGTPEYHNKTHVVLVALEQFRERRVPK